MHVVRITLQDLLKGEDRPLKVSLLPRDATLGGVRHRHLRVDFKPLLDRSAGLLEQPHLAVSLGELHKRLGGRVIGKLFFQLSDFREQGAGFGCY